MHWFGGTIAEAVNLSKQRNAIFVVFVEGNNDHSKALNATLDTDVVRKRLVDPNNFLAVKLMSGSENYTYFAQIYQFVPVPSLFFIGRNGTPLEVVCAGVDAQSLAVRIDRILQEHRKMILGKEDGQSSQSVQPSTSAQNVKEQTYNFIESEALTGKRVENDKPVMAVQPENKSTATKNAHTEETGPAAKVAKTEEEETSGANTQYEVVCDGDVCVRPARGQAGPSSGAAPRDKIPEAESDGGADEKMEKAKELIEIRRREKAAKEKEEERKKELERRSVGQGVAELKKWQAEQELKQAQEERKREKMENNLARQKILEQIAQDRAERKARDQPIAPAAAVTGGAGAGAAGAAGAAAGAGAGAAGAGAGVGDAAHTRLHFKLPAGEPHVAQFPAHATLAAVRRHLADNLQLAQESFSLWTAFPRRELSDDSATLAQLQLVPSAALLLLPRRAPAAPATPAAPAAGLLAFLTQLFTTLVLAPSYQVYSWLRDRIFPSPSNPSTPADAQSPSNPPNTPSQGLRRRGNIHRLTGDTPNDDDNNTWNGNSTQQM